VPWQSTEFVGISRKVKMYWRLQTIHDRFISLQLYKTLHRAKGLMVSTATNGTNKTNESRDPKTVPPSFAPSLLPPAPSHIIHYIWIQGVEHLRNHAPVFFENLSLWPRMFSGWEVRVWDDASIRRELAATDKELGLDLVSVYDGAAKMAVKADIARYPILYTHGGLYVDADLECLRPFAHMLLPDRVTAMTRNLYDVVERRHLARTNNSIFYMPQRKCAAALAMMRRIATRPLPSTTEQVLTYAGPKALFEVLTTTPGDVQWLPVDMFEPVQIHTMNKHGLRGDAARAAFPFAFTAHTYTMSWLPSSGRRLLFSVSKTMAYVLQQRTLLAIILLVVLLVFVPVCAVFITLWAVSRRHRA
jgi:hypothetical protein